LLKGIAPEQVVEIKGGEEKTVDVINLNSPERGGTLLVRIPKPDGKTFYTVETRLFDDLYDRPGVLRSEGVVIHEIEPGRNQRSPTPGSKAADGADALVVAPPNATKGNAGKVAWQPGQVFVDSANGIQIKIVNKVSRGYRILVSYK
jgi:hypothetical protein